MPYPPPLSTCQKFNRFWDIPYIAAHNIKPPTTIAIEIPTVKSLIFYP
jgi:hypothetical protein